MDPNSLSWIYGLTGLVGSVVGTGSAVRNSIQPYPTPPAAITSPPAEVGQSCMRATNNDLLVTGTFRMVQHRDGKITIECIPDNEAPRR